MTEMPTETPVVLSLSSHDPSGSTGLQADIESCFSLGVHCCGVVTALCARDTRQIVSMTPTDTSLIIAQARAILEDMPVSAIKLGYFCQVTQIEAAHSILRDYPELPVLLDPVMHLSIAGDGQSTADSEGDLCRAITTLLMPLATITTPDIVEANSLARQADTADACGQQILNHGSQAVLITGTSRTNKDYINTLYVPGQQARRYSWPRLSHFSHGSGATLSASISAYLAYGLRLTDAVEQGQEFTWQSLNASRRLGMGQCIPNRLFWADKHNKR
ncbi:hydroxymethylpyrimidine/phosphomethylpyrimidine kinase [Gilvimarinus sp. SDUM040013]|uniref:hydroxymethylpyrimidine kinase n=1 Tax=Gilvimarinus gilvus TaxID=3058038 RepID=A0ABU4RTY6_9GAMM|nr:hydroxymethylpyrimidine/phosphomethylpyrimidine kinase [Gilvimarinus sp. SDUM040013]MDO3386718.1 hydroxymethylpyrimidine/phosphomethylpyrimidine kinase [Gilvimarinus sp. SDUM040013]MDX6848352.1 hydroxymethylpyrimidine/phosphomethylpyrimidine kinase [Gilvimarinus sp. SDUM040013]